MRPDDHEQLCELHREPTFWQFPLGRGQNRLETEAFLARTLERYCRALPAVWAVVDRETGALAGWSGLSPPEFLPEIMPAIEVGWRLGSAFRGRGLATEAGAAWLDQGFEKLALERIVSVYEPANVASARVMTKLGFEVERRTIHPVGGAELVVMALDRRRWRALVRAGR